eukprot:14190577-Alexandrium_andersonii.AAC.1
MPEPGSIPAAAGPPADPGGGVLRQRSSWTLRHLLPVGRPRSIQARAAAALSANPGAPLGAFAPGAVLWPGSGA